MSVEDASYHVRRAKVCVNKLGEPGSLHYREAFHEETFQCADEQRLRDGDAVSTSMGGEDGRIRASVKNGVLAASMTRGSAGRDFYGTVFNDPAHICTQPPGEITYITKGDVQFVEDLPGDGCSVRESVTFIRGPRLSDFSKADLVCMQR